MSGTRAPERAIPPSAGLNATRALIVAPIGRDAELIGDLLRRAGLASLICSTIDEACSEATRGAALAIVGEEALNARVVETIAQLLHNQAPWSDFPLILLTSAGEVTAYSQRQRAMREPLGNVLLLERPVRPETLISSVENALRARLRQYQIRDQLAQYRKAEEALRRSEKLAVAGRLAASIAHEINNPLESVTNLLFLMKTVPSAELNRQYLLMAEQELARVTEITKQTLRFYREPAQPAPVSVVEVLESVLSLFHSRIQGAGVTVQGELTATTPVLGAPGELRQIFSNLVGNSIDAMRQGGRLRIRARDIAASNGCGRAVRVSIGDTGSGIPESVFRHIFEPFVSTKGDTGTGLGLWVTAEILNKLSGKIRVKTCFGAPASGTVFSIVLPGADSAS